MIQLIWVKVFDGKWRTLQAEKMGVRMVHYFSIVLVIWGLVVQPLMAAMPEKMDMNDNPALQVLNDFMRNEVDAHTEYHQHIAKEDAVAADDHFELASAKMPCHDMRDQMTGDDAQATPCDHCQSRDFASHCIVDSVCATSCAAHGASVTVASLSMGLPARLQSIVLPYFSQSLLTHFPFCIYHPPKPA